MPCSTATTRAALGLLLSGALLGAPLVGAGCASDERGMTPIDPSKLHTPLAEVAELEIRAQGMDRFTVCPPPGDLGQPWFPVPTPWTPAAPAGSPASSAAPVSPAGSPASSAAPASPPGSPASSAAPASSGASAPAPGDAASAALDPLSVPRVHDRTPSELAGEASHRELRACYRRGLVHDAAQEGRVALILRVGADGRVVRVEDYAACELAEESLACMKAAAMRLRFSPPPGGSDTVILPAVFTSRDGVKRGTGSLNEPYTATAFLVIESARPGLHACEQQARRDLRPPQAAATFTLALGKDGQVLRAHVDPWTGEQSLLACAAHELEKLRFPAPASGVGTVIARLNFNPRQGSR
jgi:hypothetical protein